MGRNTVKRRLVQLALAALGLSVAAGAAYGYARSWQPSVEAFPIQGVGVSAAQGAVHWPTVKAEGADFAYLKATDGGADRDQSFERNWAETKSAGLRRGAYHAYSLCRAAVEQATSFIATVPREAEALPPAIILQFEESCPARPLPAQIRAEVTKLVMMIEAHSGKPAILRTAPDFDEAYGISTAIPRPQWRARNFLAPNQEKQPWVMWRASDFRRIDGIEGPVDWNVVRE